MQCVLTTLVCIDKAGFLFCEAHVHLEILHLGSSYLVAPLEGYFVCFTLGAQSNLFRLRWGPFPVSERIWVLPQVTAKGYIPTSALPSLPSHFYLLWFRRMM